MKLPRDASTRFLAGAVCKLSPQDKNDGNNRKARDNVEHIFGDGFEHSRPRVGSGTRLADPSEGALNWAFISTSSSVLRQLGDIHRNPPRLVPC